MGHFYSGRGLRQEDPISPYLFLVIMEVFSSLIKWNAETKGYDYHPKCNELEITNIAFTDDLFLVATDPGKSCSLMKETIDEFKEICGLAPNL